MSRCKVSFIIPVYNFEDYIVICVESIIHQSYSDIEIIIVDDGSTDRTADICDKLANEDSRIRVLHKRNNGVSYARNKGLEVAKGDYVVFVDADDYIAPDFTDYMLGLVRANNSDFGLSLNCFCNKTDSQVAQDNVAVLEPNDAVALLLSPRVTVGSWNKIFRRDFLNDNNIRFSTDLFYGEGLHFIVRAANASNNIVVGQRKVYFYRRNNFESATSKFNIENSHNGWKALSLIENYLGTPSRNVRLMLEWHKTQFRMGTVIRILECKRKSEYREHFLECLRYVRRNTWRSLFVGEVSLYKKMLLLGCCVCPRVMAYLDLLRRRSIANASV